jgi:hypothetical protein
MFHIAAATVCAVTCIVLVAAACRLLRRVHSKDKSFRCVAVIVCTGYLVAVLPTS